MHGGGRRYRPGLGGAWLIVLVADVAHELFEEILERDDPGQLPGAVTHDGEVSPPAQHLEQEVVAPSRDPRLGHRPADH